MKNQKKKTGKTPENQTFEDQIPENQISEDQISEDQTFEDQISESQTSHARIPGRKNRMQEKLRPEQTENAEEYAAIADGERTSVSNESDNIRTSGTSSIRSRGKTLSVLLIVNLIFILILAMFTIITSARVNGLYDSLDELVTIVTTGEVFNSSHGAAEPSPILTSDSLRSEDDSADNENSAAYTSPDNSLSGTYTEFTGDNMGTEEWASGINGADAVFVLSDESFSATSYAALHKAEYLDAPVDYTDSEVISRLFDIAQTDETYRQIYERRNTYPYGFLKGLINNPEQLDFVKNYDGIKDTAAGGLTEDEKNAKFPLFLQWDERWGYISYGNSTISVAGCGPTCLSMILFALTRDENYTPDFCADYAMNKGYYLLGTGTKWALFETGPRPFGVSSEKIDNDKEQIFDAIDAGKMLVFSVAPGFFTSYGHFIVIYGMDEDGLLLVNDPNCVYRSTVHWDYEDIRKQIKAVWTFEKSPES